MGGFGEYHAKENKSEVKSQEPYDFNNLAAIKQTATNEQTRQTNKTPHRHRQQCGGYQNKRGVEEMKSVKGVSYMVMEGDLTLGDEHTMQYTDGIELYT